MRWTQNSEKIAFLELPGMALHIQTKHTMVLANSLENPDSNQEDAFNLTKEVYQASEEVR
ncbi:hypothetical protein [Leptospira meyeri]|uniref:hypothetical protein n=1 Tax=Leptospira meyeri TaxID=29508 RepID=UPI000C2B18E0|nr:hypothetical protein [Leptospira meyeri]PJZ80551.1 hypothetical protein CH359_12210 [Leptospira meyeri]PJZ95711.1 hypothetical protein CH358_15245 [Leptospira meyeri]